MGYWHTSTLSPCRSALSLSLSLSLSLIVCARPRVCVQLIARYRAGLDELPGEVTLQMVRAAKQVLGLQ